MYPFDRHDRIRRDLSAYIDGELPPRDATNLEAHLESCDGCRRLLEELRAASATLSTLPTVAAPRSFALTPEMAASRPPATEQRAAAAYVMGLRYAAAGLAVALAVVMFADRADFGSDEDSQGARTQQMDMSAEAPLGAAEDGAGGAGGEEAQATSDSQFGGGGVGGGAGGAAATSVPPAASSAPAANDAARASDAPDTLLPSDGDETTEEFLTNGAAAADEAVAEGDDDTAWTIIEAALALLLGAAFMGVAWTWFARRRQA